MGVKLLPTTSENSMFFNLPFTDSCEVGASCVRKEFSVHGRILKG